MTEEGDLAFAGLDFETQPGSVFFDSLKVFECYLPSVGKRAIVKVTKCSVTI